MSKKRLKPRIPNRPAYGDVKAAILDHYRHLPEKFRPYFLRPRWDVKNRILRGSDNWAIGYEADVEWRKHAYMGPRAAFSKLVPKTPGTVVYRLVTDEMDRDVYRQVHHRRHLR